MLQGTVEVDPLPDPPRPPDFSTILSAASQGTNHTLQSEGTLERVFGRNSTIWTGISKNGALAAVIAKIALCSVLAWPERLPCCHVSLSASS